MLAAVTVVVVPTAGFLEISCVTGRVESEDSSSSALRLRDSVVSSDELVVLNDGNNVLVVLNGASNALVILDGGSLALVVLDDGSNVLVVGNLTDESNVVEDELKRLEEVGAFKELLNKLDDDERSVDVLPGLVPDNSELVVLIADDDDKRLEF